MNDRRSLLVSLGAGALALAAPPGSFAQPRGKVWRVGFLSPISASRNQLQIGAFLKGMRDLGYVEGELAINLKTAKALGMTIPQSLLLRADEVIQ